MTSRRRVEYIDGLRGVAVVVMFFVHAAVAWLAPETRGGTYWSWSMTASGLVAPTFLFLAGLSMAVGAERERVAGVELGTSRARLVRRGLEIVAVGYALHFTFFALAGFDGTWTRIFKVDVLHCIGLSMILFARLARPLGATNPRAGAMFVILPVLAWAVYRLPIHEALPGGLAAYVSTRPSLALFPFVPYGAWVALGLCVAPRYVAAASDSRKEARFAVGLLVAAAAAYGFGRALGTLYYDLSLHTLEIAHGEPLQSKGIVHLFWTKASFVFLFFALAILTKAIWRLRGAGSLLLLGKRSLFAYGAHLIVIYPLAGPILSERLLPSEHAALSVALTFAMVGLVRLRARVDLVSLVRGPTPSAEPTKAEKWPAEDARA